MKVSVAREGWPFVTVPAVLAVGLLLGGRRALALPFAAASLASLGFFRDPDREVPSVPGGVLSPADGRVLSVETIEDRFVGPAIRVGIFLSPLDVHVNRSPIAGLVVGTVYSRGRFLAAYRSEAEGANERCSLHLQGETARVTVVQIAGVLARRIVCRVGPGDKLVRLFGRSNVDIHGVSLSAELRRFGEAVARAERIVPEDVPSRERRGRLYG